MKLHIGNLPKNLSDAEVTTLVTPFGETTVEVVRDQAGSSKGFGFAEFTDDEQARAAITGLNGKDVGGNVLRVAEARPRKSDAKQAVS